MWLESLICKTKSMTIDLFPILNNFLGVQQEVRSHR